MTTLIRTCSDGDLLILTDARRRVKIAPDALAVADATGLDIDGDIDTTISRVCALPIRDDESIASVRARLLDECLDGADADRVDGWRGYVDAVMDAATGPDDRDP